MKGSSSSWSQGDFITSLLCCVMFPDVILRYVLCDTSLGAACLPAAAALTALHIIGIAQGHKAAAATAGLDRTSLVMCC
jgi:hypothetical protein